MPKRLKTKTKARRRSSNKLAASRPAKSAADLSRLEFHRSAVALMPDPADRRPGIAFQIDGRPKQVDQQFCSCRTSGTATCAHQKELSQVLAACRDENEDGSFYNRFQSGLWHRLATVLAETQRETPATIRLATIKSAGQNHLKVVGSDDRTLIYYFSAEIDRERFLERCTQPPGDAAVPTRGEIIRQLALLTLTKNERVLMDRGLKTRRQVLEETFWYKFAYHCFREFGPNGCTLHPAIDESSGAFMVSGRTAPHYEVFKFEIPRNSVKRVLQECAGMFCNQHGLAVSPIPLDAIFDIKLTAQLDIEISPLLRAVSKEGEAKFFQREDLKRFQYGDLYFIKELNLLAEDCYPEPPPKSFDEPVKTVIEKSQVPAFLDQNAAELESSALRIHPSVRRLKILKNFDRLEITPQALERDWLWLSINYGAGSQSISLVEILKARQAKQRYVATGEGWVDCNSAQFDILDLLARGQADAEPLQDGQAIRLRRTDLLRLKAAEGQQLHIGGDGRQAGELKNFLDLNSITALPKLNGRVSPLRDYQVRGVEWLWFLFENGFGGLLCDDMGLGKTHQVMALMTALQSQSRKTGPFLVVCPTTVISHWQKKIVEHAPVLKPGIYHGGERNIDSLLTECNTVLTSYGILLRDIEKIAKLSFTLAVFDEIQYLKNSETLTYRAARAVRAQMTLGLTGTPIENSVTELKALMDLTAPGYLGSDADFISRYADPIEAEKNAARREELSRLVAPFTLRRLKQSVLTELPAKIEDVRTCRLSDDQIKLYRDAVDQRGRELQAALQSDGQRVPYMHIFALLNLLKQICDHPALVEKDTGRYDRYTSGKWDLFCELLVESLDSGQKVVIYSQYLGMIDIIEAFLRELNVGYVSLTGQSRNRGAIIQRFNEDDDCRVYIGSLRAGGTGIDLVAASVVIHYDRWWNAAREDQATDRVHRIGQRRGVQVFKLVTEGTLEEKIAAIIAKKRKLQDSVVKEDDPGLLKTFTKQELVELLAMPATV